MITPLYFGRTKSFCQQVMNMNYPQAEDVVLAQAKVFEENKPYLLQRFAEWKEKEAAEQKIEVAASSARV
jgi:hypothetical protein